MILKTLQSKDLISPPKWLCDNTVFLTIMGSKAYGVSNDDSDVDIYGYCVPPKNVVFPHLNGEIIGFGEQKKRFEQWQQHHIIDKERSKEYDFSVYSIVKYFHLLMQNNPNIIDSLFTPRNCVIHSAHISEMVRENRNIFLHKGCWHKFKGYSYSQLTKMQNRHNTAMKLREYEELLGLDHDITFEEASSINIKLLDVDEYHTYQTYIREYRLWHDSSHRNEKCKRIGYDTKFAFHLIRLLSEVEEILSTGNLTLDEYGRRKQLRAIRDGMYSYEDIVTIFKNKEQQLEKLYNTSTLPWEPDEKRIKNLLLDCLEHHYGSIDKCIIREDKLTFALKEIQKIIEGLGPF